MAFNWRDPALKVLLVWWRLTRPRTVGVRGIVTDQTGRILFVKHNYGSRRWYLPGGGSNGGESADQSMVREIREETGLDVAVTRLVGVYFWDASYKRDHIFVFACDLLGGALKIDGGEIGDAGWYPAGALPQPLVEGTEVILTDWRTGHTGFGRWPSPPDHPLT